MFPLLFLYIRIRLKILKKFQVFEDWIYIFRNLAGKS